MTDTIDLAISFIYCLICVMYRSGTLDGHGLEVRRRSYSSCFNTLLTLYGRDSKRARKTSWANVCLLYILVNIRYDEACILPSNSLIIFVTYHDLYDVKFVMTFKMQRNVKS